MQQGYPQKSDEMDIFYIPLAILAFIGVIYLVFNFFLPGLEIRLTTAEYEACFFSRVPVIGKYTRNECQQLIYLDKEIARAKASGVNISVEKVRHYISVFSRNTRKIVSCITAFLCLLICFFMFLGAFKSEAVGKSDIDNLISSPIKKAGVEGFIDLVSPYLSDDLIEKIRQEPTPRNLADAFALVRKKANIPNNLAARCFPPLSLERLAILQVGKRKEYDLRVIRQWRESECRTGKADRVNSAEE